MRVSPEEAPTLSTPERASWTRPFARVVGMQFVFGLGFAVLSIAPTMLVRRYHADAREVGVTTATLAFGAVALAPIAGLALDRVGRVLLIRVGCVVAALAMALFALNLDSVLLRRAFLFLAGAAFVIVFNGTSAMVADIAPGHSLARAMGWHGASNMVAHAIAPTLAEHLAPSIGWPSVFLAGACMILVAGVLAAGLEDTRGPGERTSSISFGGAREVLRVIAPLLLAAALVGGAYGSVFSFQQPYMIAKGATAVRAYFVGFTAGALVMRLGFGGLADRFGHAKTTRISAGLYGLVALAFTVVTPRTLGLGGLGHGVAHGMLYPALVALVLGRVNARDRGLAASVTNGAFHLGHAGTSLALGALAASQGIASVFVVGSALAWGAILLTRDQRGTSTV